MKNVQHAQPTAVQRRWASDTTTNTDTYFCGQEVIVKLGMK